MCPTSHGKWVCTWWWRPALVLSLSGTRGPPSSSSWPLLTRWATKMPAVSWTVASIDVVDAVLTYFKNFSSWRLLSFHLQGTVCGLCGNFDDQTKNDFTTRDHMVVTSELDFGNSWKEASTCPDVHHTPDPCTLNPHRRSWAEKQCSIIKSVVFKGCHSKVGMAAGMRGPQQGRQS